MAIVKKYFGFSKEIGRVLETIEDLLPEPSRTSIANQLVTALDYSGFKKQLQKCQTEVTCVTSGAPFDESKLCVLEVEVKPSRDGLAISTESGVDEWCSELRGLPKAFLVSSESVSMIEAKLAVYRKFKYDIDNKGIQIHHILDESESFLNHCGYSAIDRFQKTVEELKNSVPVEEVRRIVTQAADHIFSRGNIRDTCKEVYLVDNGDNIGTVRNESYACRFYLTVRRIKLKLLSETVNEIEKSFYNKMFRHIFEHMRPCLEGNTKADLHKINKSISEETFSKFDAHMVVMTVLSSLFMPIIEVLEFAVGLISNFVWPVDINSIGWRNKVADEIYHEVCKGKVNIVQRIISSIEGIYKTTKQDLHFIITKLNDAKKHVCPQSQKQIAEEWMLQDSRNEGMDSNNPQNH